MKIGTPVSAAVYRFRLWERREWERTEVERIEAENRYWDGQEAILCNPNAGAEEKAAARLAIAGKMYRELRSQFPDEVAS